VLGELVGARAHVVVVARPVQGVAIVLRNVKGRKGARNDDGARAG
jgi:hypothetical protein